MLATQVDVSKMEAATGIPFSTLYAFRRGSIKEIRLDYLDKIAAYLLPDYEVRFLIKPDAVPMQRDMKEIWSERPLVA